MDNSQLAQIDDCDFRVLVTLRIVAESARKAALYAFHNSRDRLRRRPQLEFDSSVEGYTGYAVLHAESILIRAANGETDTIVFSSTLNCPSSLSNLRHFEVSIDLSVTANDCAEAAQYAVDDLADDELDSWNVEVTQTLTSGATHCQPIRLSRGRDY